MEEFEIVDLSYENNILKIACYNGNYFEYFDNEKVYCYHFIIKNIEYNDDLEILIKDYDKYLMYIFENENKILFYDYSYGNEVIIKDIEIIRVDGGTEILLYKKLKMLFDKYNAEYESNVNNIKKINELKIYLNNEIEKINKKIEFYEKNNAELFNNNVEKKEIVINILKKIEN